MAPTRKTPAPAAKRMTLSQVLEHLLTRSGTASTVTITENTRGETSFEVAARAETVEDAERQAVEVYERLHARFPASRDDTAASVALTRNAKGETQIATEHKRTGGPRALVHLLDNAAGDFEHLRARFPLADGTATHDAAPKG
jgi:hypothetical protein